MPSRPNIYCIHSSDAPQHLSKIEELSQKFKQEQRITDFIPLFADDASPSLTQRFKKNDLIILLLTYGLEAKRKNITTLLSEVKVKFPESIIAEIIIDNIPFVNEYITLPKDLKPIRDAQNMEIAWGEIEENLKQMLPTTAVGWKNYLKYAVPIIVALIALIIWRPWQKERTANFAADPLACEAPCLVKFTTSENAERFEWDFGDGQKSTEKNPTHTYSIAGEYTVSLTAGVNNDVKQKSQVIAISTPPEPERVVKSVSSMVVNPNFSGNCPYEYFFSGSIEVNKPGNVEYNWIRSDGSSTPVETLNFTEPGKKEIQSTWNLGDVGEEYTNYWQQLKVIAPNEGEMLSEKSVFNLRCATVFGEDCLLFNYQNVTIDSSSTSPNPSRTAYRIKDGNTFLQILTSGENAKLAIKIIKEYRLDKVCWVGYPTQGLRYFTVKGDIPSGRYEGENCTRIYNSENLTIHKKSDTSFEIMDGNRVAVNTRSQSDADMILKILKHYKPGYVCYLDGYNMMYLRK